MQIIIYSLINASTISILAIAFSLLYLSTRYFALELGAVFVAAPFLLQMFLSLQIPFVVALLLTFIMIGLLSISFEVFNHSRLEKRNASVMAHLISSLGIYILLTQLVIIIWGNETHFLRSGIDNIFFLGSLRITDVQIISVIVSLIIIILYLSVLKFSKTGLVFKGISDNQTEMLLRGFNINKIRIVVFIISGLLAASSSLFYAYDLGFDAHSGLNILIYAIVAVIIGGKDSYYGPILGSLILSIVQTATVWFFSASWMDAGTFLLFVLFLFLKPSGILSGKFRLEAQA
jgi:branched-chain amino acid transport system permease protein